MDNPETHTFIADIAYLGADRSEKMDAYLPGSDFSKPTPAVLLIHGGGWRGSDKRDARERNIGSNLAAHGYAVFSINYLLNTDTTIAWPTNFTDCKSALRFLKLNAERFGIDPDRIATMGGSAGGHLAMLVGATAQVGAVNDWGLYTHVDNRVRCIINFYGVHDVQDRRAVIFAGKDAAQTEANARMASPRTHFGADTPPIFIAHGTADTTVPVEHSRVLVRELTALGIEHEYVEIPDAPHTFHLQPQQMDLRPAVLAFLARHLGLAAARDAAQGAEG